jgi:hypothetical protein
LLCGTSCHQDERSSHEELHAVTRLLHANVRSPIQGLSAPLGAVQLSSLQSPLLNTLNGANNQPLHQRARFDSVDRIKFPIVSSTVTLFYLKRLTGVVYNCATTMRRLIRSHSFTYGDQKTDFAARPRQASPKIIKQQQQQQHVGVMVGTPIPSTQYRKTKSDSRIALSLRPRDTITRDGSNLKVVLGAQVTVVQQGHQDQVHCIYAGNYIKIQKGRNEVEVVFGGCARYPGNEYKLAVCDVMTGRVAKVPVDQFLGLIQESRPPNPQIAATMLEELFKTNATQESKKSKIKLKQNKPKCKQPQQC